MITIPPATSAAVAINTPTDQETQVTDAVVDTTLTETASGANPLAKFGLNDLHTAVQAFAAFGPNEGGADPWLARQMPQGHGAPQGTGAPLYQKQAGGPTQGQPIAAPVKPGAPVDIRQMEALNAKIQAYRVKGSPIPEHELLEVKQKFKDATAALKAGDYRTAEAIFKSLDFPLPAPKPGEKLQHYSAITAVMLGVRVHDRGHGGWQMDNVNWGKRGHQGLNDIDGFAANTIMINRLSTLKGGVSNPPTEAQVRQYMQDLANPPKGTKAPTTQDLMKAASEITNGFIVHYSSAGAQNPKYNDNPNQHAYYKDKAGNVHEFPSVADALAAAKANNPPAASKIIPVIAKSPDQWSDITSQGARAGRNIGDCESKLFLQTEALTAAGFQLLGAVHVDPKNGGSGHMLGVFKAKDGTVWVTSNEEFRQVHASDKSKGVTQGDVDRVVKEMTAEIYKIEPNFRGDIDLSDFRLATAATANLPSPSVATDTIRRSTELNQMGRNDTLIPPPPKKP